MKREGLHLLCWMVAVVVLTACGAATEHDHQDHGKEQTQDADVEAPLETTVTFAPETVQAGEETTVRIEITQNGETVKDANQVSFDVWPEGTSAEEREKVETELVNGAYQGTYSFPEAGEYHVMYHITARGDHRMDTVEVSVQP
ncbi:FixH family protein [Desmospora activa]|nr:FixH family protein [Desmospora activa]